MGLGRFAALYFSFVGRSCGQPIIEPSNIIDYVDFCWPCILATWHGQAYVLPFAMEIPRPIRILVSNSKDGRILQDALLPLGIEVIVGSGMPSGSKPVASKQAEKFSDAMMRRRSLGAGQAMLKSLEEGCAVAMTADVPTKNAGHSGRGIVQIARRSGRPIIPVGVMTTHRLRLRNWDRTVINLPFGRLAMVIGSPIFVEDTADEAVLETKRQAVETSLNEVNARAAALLANRGT
jgi:lysophospholipid acyltransferase (LPLAT)-like uncharacterized protein